MRLGTLLVKTLIAATLLLSSCAPGPLVERADTTPCAPDGGIAAATCPLTLPAAGDACNEEMRCKYCAVEATTDDDDGAGPVAAMRCDGSLWVPG
jgi:hypothetical protein